MFSSLVFGQNKTIENYDLGRLFEKLQSLDYTDYKNQYEMYFNRIN